MLWFNIWLIYKMPQFSTNTQNALEYLYVCVSKSFLGGYLFDFFF